MSRVRYELGVYIPEDGILHSRLCEDLKSFDDLPRRGGSNGALRPEHGRSGRRVH
jgi:hypothetical protein